MNTGIGDAINLGWKLAQVIRGRADASLLDSYEKERIVFAQRLVATTDRAFVPLVAGGWGGAFIRGILVPLIFAVVTRFQATRHAAFSTLSQTQIHHEDSPLSEGKAGSLQGGERLPHSRRHERRERGASIGRL
jgi:2-polyprenyl-6-methoxyphenol hydroxylase-like FAD-dependent oxidoreductase